MINLHKKPLVELSNLCSDPVNQLSPMVHKMTQKGNRYCITTYFVPVADMCVLVFVRLLSMTDSEPRKNDREGGRIAKDKMLTKNKLDQRRRNRSPESKSLTPTKKLETKVPLRSREVQPCLQLCSTSFQVNKLNQQRQPSLTFPSSHITTSAKKSEKKVTEHQLACQENSKPSVMLLSCRRPSSAKIFSSTPRYLPTQAPI